MFRRCCRSKEAKDKETQRNNTLIQIELITLSGQRTKIEIKYGTSLEHLQRVIKEKYRQVNKQVRVENEWTLLLRQKKIELSGGCCTSELGNPMDTITLIYLVFQKRKAKEADIPRNLLTF